MKPLIVLLAAFVASILVLKLINRQIDFHLAGRIAMACMLTFTAIGHFVFAKGMAAMIPSIIPYKMQLILLTGVMEVLFGVGLLFPKTKLLASWVIIVFFILLLPANIRAAINNINYQTGELDGPGLMYLWFRVPLQILFIIWVYIVGVRG